MDSSNQSFVDRVRTNRLATTFVLLGTLTVGVLAGSILTSSVSGKEQHVDSSDAHAIVIPSPATLSNGFSEIVKRDGPAVVNINTESIPKQAVRRGKKITPRGNPNDDQQQNPGDMQDFFNRFFGGQGGGQGGDDEEGGGGERRALGSGFIVDPSGYIITNNHVVDKADKIFVKLSTDPENGADSGRPATVVGVDTETDIAVIKIDTKDLKTPLTTIKLGNSDGAQVGDWVLAIGSPFGLSQTVSAGIVSAKNRTIEDQPSANGVATNQFQRFIQTDAAINPGNSGGPLVDMNGNVVGMNTAIYTQSAGSQGVGFAMPSNIVAKIYNDLIGPTHKVVRGSIGITFQAAQSSAVSRMYGFSSGGVIVSTITPNGGAAKAGIQPQDVLVTIDGRQIKDGDDLVADISARPVGTNVKIGYLRDGKEHTALVTVADRAKTYADLAGGAPPENDQPEESDAGQTKLGITVTPIPAAVAQKLGIKGGVTVTSVTPGSFSDEIGLGKGALIVEINRRPVTDEASYRAAVSNLKVGDDVVFVIRDTRKAGGVSYLGDKLR